LKRVFYIECAGAVWRSIADHCRRNAAWQPVLWTAPADDRPAVLNLNPDAVFIAGPDAALGMPGHAAPWPLPALDPVLLAALSNAEITALHMMDRMDIASGKGFTHDQRRRHYYGLLRYWLGALEALKPDLIVFSISPHIVFDYVLFALARHLGIATVMFERLGMPGWVFPIESFAHGSDALRSALKERPTAQASELPGDFQKWFVNSTKGQADVPANYQKKLARYGLQGRAATPPAGAGHGLRIAARGEPLAQVWFRPDAQLLSAVRVLPARARRLDRDPAGPFTRPFPETQPHAAV
jgi:hypothetical protein